MYLVSTLLILIALDYVVHRIQTIKQFKLFEKLIVDKDLQLARISSHFEEKLASLEKKLCRLINSELDKVDEGYNNLDRKILFLQSRLGESYERMTLLEDSLFDTMSQYIENIQNNVAKLDQNQQEYTNWAEECRRRMDECQQKMNEWSDSKICDIYCQLRCLHGQSVDGVLTKILEIKFPHIKFNQIPNDVCVRNAKLIDPNWGY